MAGAHRVYIGLGSNLEQPAIQIKTALDSLQALPKTKVIKSSQLYASKPQGPQDQPDFVNAVCQLETGLQPLALLDALQSIEQQQGRVKKRHWGERLIDLDILLFDDQILNSERLIVPHKELSQRDFVLLPLLEISPGLVIPGLGSVEQLTEQLKQTFVIPWQAVDLI